MNEAVITLADGAGGADSQKLLAAELLPLLSPEFRDPLEDAAYVILPPPLCPGDGGLVVTTDGFAVRPLIFPGGDIGTLAVCGTVNDLAMRGAQPVLLGLSMILEEGLPLPTLRTVVQSIRRLTREVGVAVVAGDTKVVERGRGDGMFLAVTGLGRPRAMPPPGVLRARPGDRVLISGTIGDHGLAVLSAREDLGLVAGTRSDCAPLWSLVELMLGVGGDGVHVLRDPTRGGVAAALNELAAGAGVGVVLQQEALPVRPAVAAACDLLGYDVLTVANEGKLLALVAEGCCQDLLAAMSGHPLGRESAVIGEVTAAEAGRVVMETALGTRRLVDMPAGELLPRIC